MIKWAIIFFIVSLFPGFFGFTRVAEASRILPRFCPSMPLPSSASC